ncbi:MAG TPA: PP2C family protein-serine/threonine phosphatase [Thermoanaerobaculia bacterium]|nr:PP2C family protein-serine/threonine phosphatase [Thermoanaerobaculia bacterium]
MRNVRSLVLWLLAGAAGLALLIWAFPRAFPFAPSHWTASRGEAAAIALERFRDLGPPVRNPYVVARLSQDYFLERRLQLAVDRHGWAPVRGSRLPKQILTWEVYVYPKDSPRFEWTYRAEVSLAGEVVYLRRHLDPEEKIPAISPQEARSRAEAFLRREGLDLAGYGEPELRSQQLARRTDLAVRFPDRANPLLGGATHGAEVFFAGNQLTGFGYWLDDPGQKALAASLRSVNLLGVLRVVWVCLLAALLAFPFLKRYHEGEIGVRRGVQIFLLVLLAGVVSALLSSRADSEGNGFGLASRQQNTWLVVLFEMVFMMVPAGVLAFFAWSVGESICRERWGHKLAAFDALFQGDVANETVARSAFRGWMAGLAVTGALTALLLAARRMGVWGLSSLMVEASTRWPGVEILAGSLAIAFPFLLAIILWLLPVAARHLGRWGGSLAATVVGTVVIPPLLIAAPLSWTTAVSLLTSAVLVGLFLKTDLLTALLAGFVPHTFLTAWPLLTAGDSSLKIQGWIAIAVLAAPLLASLRHLGSGKQFVYRYEDVPPHVRRIAERERQRVELETARRIQSSILPDLPPRLAGVDIAHAYLPASEVGGDFYDVLALEDGRLAVAVGDVAGHGVSSGLIMSMAKSALAVQVTFDPEVAAVFNTLNRTVYQTARKRLLATLCYALIDPRRLEMIYASAGHLYPYRISATGRVESLESIAYPLGVRGQLMVDPRTARLSPGDTLFLFSDGVVEARREGSDDLFGFERLEESLARHTGRGPEGLRDGVLADVARFTGDAPREDDQTIVVLRLP